MKILISIAFLFVSSVVYGENIAYNHVTGEIKEVGFGNVDRFITEGGEQYDANVTTGTHKGDVPEGSLRYYKINLATKNIVNRTTAEKRSIKDKEKAFKIVELKLKAKVLGDIRAEESDPDIIEAIDRMKNDAESKINKIAEEQ